MVQTPSEGVGKRVLVCPSCGSHRIYWEAGLILGQLYHCKNCDYVGPLAIERDVVEEE